MPRHIIHFCGSHKEAVIELAAVADKVVTPTKAEISAAAAAQVEGVGAEGEGGE